MPKHGALTPKAIANRIKAKGLQKLRWYCQMCQKQCRDENGFKCHTMSESHQRQLLLFAENPDKYIDSFSQDFLDSFMELLKRRFGTKRVHANQVYQEYIADRQHLHMNATQWETLTEFVKWLGREGHVVADYTEKGWFITYIDRDPETIRRQEAVAKKEKMDMDDEERMAKFLQIQIERGKEQTKNVKESHYTECVKESEDDKVEFSLKASLKKEKEIEKQNVLATPHSSKDRKDSISRNPANESKKRSALDDLMQEQEKVKEKRNRKDYWLAPGIIVKVLAKKLGDRYYKKKGVIQEVIDKYVGIIKMIDTGDILKLDQKYLETVIPAIGKRILVVNGAYRGEVAKLLSLSPETFSVSIEIHAGPLRGRTINGMKYEDISKLHS